MQIENIALDKDVADEVVRPVPTCRQNIVFVAPTSSIVCAPPVTAIVLPVPLTNSILLLAGK